MSIRKIMFALSLLVIVAILTTATGCNVVTGSGETITRDFDYDNFTKIETGYAFDIEVSRSDSYLVRVTVDRNLEDYLNVSQRGDTLSINLKTGFIYTNVTQKAVITLPDLRRLEASGASKANVSGFSTTESVDYEASGASRINLNQMKSGNTDFDISGASQVSGTLEMNDGQFDLSGASSLELEGLGEDITIEASGASNVVLTDFPVATADVELSGASRAIVNVNNRLDVDLSGASNLKYYGDPRIGSSSISGGSTFSSKE